MHACSNEDIDRDRSVHMSRDVKRIFTRVNELCSQDLCTSIYIVYQYLYKYLHELSFIKPQRE